MHLLQSAGAMPSLLVFSLAATLVWWSGASLSHLADEIAERTGLGRAFVGVLFLGVATSLPELATTASAAMGGHAELAGTNLLGGVAMQLAVLAVVDGLALRGKALTHFSAEQGFLMQGVLLSLLLAIAAGGIAIGDLAITASIGLLPVCLAATYLLALHVMYRYEKDIHWTPAAREQKQAASGDGEDADKPGRYRQLPMWQLLGLFTLAAGGVFAGGYFVSATGARLAEISGLGETFIGATLVAVATSLPEVSTTWSALRMGAYSLAVGNILGTNTLELALFLPADLLYTEGTIVSALDERAVFLAVLGIVLTCIYLWGVLERRDRTVLSFGIDSVLVLSLYGGAMLLLYHLT